MPLPGLPSPSSLRDATSPKVRGLGSPPSFRFILYALLSQKEPKALRGDVPPLPRAPPLGKTPSGRREMSHMRQREDSWREAPERARMLTGRLRLSLAGAYDGADFRRAQSKLTRCVLVSGLALSVIASRCHLSQSERPWQSAKFPVYTLRPAVAKRAEGAARRRSAFAKGSPFGKDSLRPEGDVAYATEGGQLARSA